MKCIDSTYKQEMNFVDEFELSRNGMIKEIKTEFDIVRFCLGEINNLPKEYIPMLDRIMIMPLRKLLCEKKPILLNVYPDFLMPKLEGRILEIEEECQEIILPPYKISDMKNWIPLDQWLKQKIVRTSRAPKSTGEIIPDFTYELIKQKLNKHDKVFLDLHYVKEKVIYKGEEIDVYIKKDLEDETINTEIFEILNKVGYNSLDLYTFIKHMADKRGAHIDRSHSLFVNLVNSKDGGLGLTTIAYLNIQMIYAAKKQVSELADYWREMLELET